VRGVALVSAVCVVLLAGACGSSAADAPAAVRVSGQVARSCAGPIVVGRPRQCSDSAVFERGGKRVTVHGTFSVALAPGTYRVTVDTCTDEQTLTVKHAITGLKLVPRCAVPL
jgi:hypothetical protein